MLNFVALGRDALLQDLPGGTRGKIAPECHGNPPGQHFTEDDQQQPCRSKLTDRHDEHQRGDQAVIEPEDDLAQPISPVRMLLIELIHSRQCSSSSCIDHWPHCNTFSGNENGIFAAAWCTMTGVPMVVLYRCYGGRDEI